ncbi:MAG: hypothetical protein ACFCVK_23780 [Acidimicrobiales bacterium]
MAPGDDLADRGRVAGSTTGNVSSGTDPDRGCGHDEWTLWTVRDPLNPPEYRPSSQDVAVRLASAFVVIVFPLAVLLAALVY